MNEQHSLHQGTEPPIAPRALEQWLPTAPGACSQCVCSLLTAVCVHLDGLNAEDQFRVRVTILDNTSHLGVTPNSRRFDASIGGARFDSQSHSRIFAGCYDHAILAIWGCSNV